MNQWRRKDKIPFPLSKKRQIKLLLKLIQKKIQTLADEKKSVKKKRKILSDPQIGHGIFTMLASMILPAIISAIAKTWMYYMVCVIDKKTIVNTKTYISFLKIYILHYFLVIYLIWLI